MARKGGLGKGISALIPEAEIEFDKKDLSEIDIELLMPKKDQPRKNFDKDKLSDLAESIKQFGIVQPIVAVKSGKGYTIVAGERRWRAAKMAGLKKAPVVIKDYSELEIEEIALIENLQRENLNPIEEAAGFKRLMDVFGLTQEQVGEKVGRSRSAVANSLRILSLPKEVTELLKEGKLTTGHAKALAAMTDEAEMIKLANLAVSRDLSVRQVEFLSKGGKKAPTKEKKADRDVENAISSSKNALQKKYGVRVKVSYNSKYKGKIEIPFTDLAQMTKLFEMLEG